MMKNMMAGIQANKTLKLSHLLIAFFLVMGTLVASYRAKAHSVAVFIEINSSNQVRFHVLSWHRLTEFGGRPSGAMFVNGARHNFSFVYQNNAANTVIYGKPSNTLRRVASCSNWATYNGDANAVQVTNWISGLNLCANMNFSMTSHILEAPACNLSGTVDVSQPVFVSQPTFNPSNSLCAQRPFSVSVVANGVNLSYKWQVSYNNGGWIDLSNGSEYTNTTTATLNYSGSSTLSTGTRYRCVVTSSGSCGTKTAESSASSSLSISFAPSITTNPIASLTLCQSSSSQLSVAATGTGLSYKWQKSSTDPSSGFSDFSPQQTGSSLTVSAAALGADFANNRYFRCLVTNSCGTSTSTSSALSVTSSTSVSNPSNVTICENNVTAATFTVTAGSTQNPTYQWQVSRNNGSTYTNISNGTVANTVTYAGANTSQLSLTGASAVLNGALYRCVVNGGCGPGNSLPATLTVNRFTTITTQPTSQSACFPISSATFSVGATGTNLSYTWQVSESGTFTNVTTIAGVITHTVNGAQLSVTPADDSYNGRQYRVLINGACGSTITSSTVTLTVASPAVISSTSTTTPVVCEGSTISLTFVATGSNLTYKWQESQNGTAPFTEVSAANYRDVNTNTLTIIGAPTGFNNRVYRGVATGSCGGPAYTGSITLTVNANPSISVQPTAQNICIPTNAATFSVTAGGYSLSYQWETSSNGGGTYTNVTSSAGVVTYTVIDNPTLTTLTVTPTRNLNQHLYRVKLTGGCGNPIYSDAKVMSLNISPSLSVSSTISICAFTSGTIELTDNGLGNTYQWQASTQTGTFSDISNTTTTNGISYAGVNTTKLTIGRVPVEQSGYLYRCLVTPNSACGTTTVTSSTITLTVNTRPAITIQPVNANNNTFLQNNQFGSITTTTYVYRVTATGSYANPSNDLVWYESRDGGQNWGAISSTTLSGTTLYTVNTTGTSPVVSELRVRMENSTVATSDYARRLGYIYRCLLSGICENITTNAVKVNPPPKVNRRQ